jgi:hypothetical protein
MCFYLFSIFVFLRDLVCYLSGVQDPISNSQYVCSGWQVCCSWTNTDDDDDDDEMMGRVS